MKRLIICAMLMIGMGCGVKIIDNEDSQGIVHYYDKPSNSCFVRWIGSSSSLVKVDCTKEFCDLIKGCE